MEKVAVIVTVQGGVAEAYSPGFVDAVVVDFDNIQAGDGPTDLPDTPAFRALAREAGLTRKEIRFVKGE
jgi:3-mercaptopyruvate sulfurtransferase SseA